MKYHHFSLGYGLRINPLNSACVHLLRLGALFSFNKQKVKPPGPDVFWGPNHIWAHARNPLVGHKASFNVWVALDDTTPGHKLSLFCAAY